MSFAAGLGGGVLVSLAFGGSSLKFVASIARMVLSCCMAVCCLLHANFARYHSCVTDLHMSPFVAKTAHGNVSIILLVPPLSCLKSKQTGLVRARQGSDHKSR